MSDLQSLVCELVKESQPSISALQFFILIDYLAHKGVLDKNEFANLVEGSISQIKSDLTETVKDGFVNNENNVGVSMLLDMAEGATQQERLAHVLQIAAEESIKPYNDLVSTLRTNNTDQSKQ